MARKIKIRKVSNWGICIALALAALCIAVSLTGMEKFYILRNATKEYVSCERAVQQLQTGSDILTKNVRLAAMTGKQEYIDAYFEEANVKKTREKAMSDLKGIEGETTAVISLHNAMAASKALMEPEFYAMRLVEEAGGVDASLWPEELKSVELVESDKALSPAEKLRRAQEIVVSVAYESAKDDIARHVNSGLTAVMGEIRGRESYAADSFFTVFKMLISCLIFFAGLMIVLALMMRFWIVRPLEKYSQSVANGEAFPACGLNELQVFAEKYNEVFEENQAYAKLITHQAEHDPLTDLLNRGSFDKVLDLYERKSADFALILVDVDTFKTVNDTYGHAVGDVILKKVAGLLTSSFRSIDYVCRIGGDEFAVVMVDMTSDLSYTIQDKVDEMNRLLSITEDGIPKVSLSVGVAFMDRENPGESLFTDADKALYFSKEHGRSQCHFYEG